MIERDSIGRPLIFSMGIFVLWSMLPLPLWVAAAAGGALGLAAEIDRRRILARRRKEASE